MTHKYIRPSKIIFETLLIFVIILSGITLYPPQKIFAEEFVDVTEFGADGFDEEDDYPAFTEALNKAKGSNKHTVVHVPGGKYYLSKAIEIFSNTKLEIEDTATLIFNGTDEGAMAYGVHVNGEGKLCLGENCNHGGYSQVVNVEIDGGTWDRNKGDDKTLGSVFVFRHASNIKIKDLKCSNANNHFINLSGVRNGVVENVTILDEMHYSESTDNGKDKKNSGFSDGDKYSYVEAIHLDYCNEEGEKSPRTMPYDDTPSRNIMIRDCNFYNIYACLGTHHYAKKEGGANITMTNCHGENIFGNCVNAYDFNNISIKNNEFLNCRSIGDISETTKIKLFGNKFVNPSGEQTGENGKLFLDVTDKKKYYYRAVYWAADMGLLDGYNDATFRPESKCTIKDLILMLWRLAGRPDIEGQMPYNDIDYDPLSESYKAILWGWNFWILYDSPDGIFYPDNAVTRVEALVMIYKFAGSPDMFTEQHYTDMPQEEYDYWGDQYQAVLWADNEGIAGGYEDGSFRPYEECNRGQVVTFLYRYAGAW